MKNNNKSWLTRPCGPKISIQVVESEEGKVDEGDEVKNFVGDAVTGGAVIRNDGERVGTALGSGTGDLEDGATVGAGLLRVILQGIDTGACGTYGKTIIILWWIRKVSICGPYLGHHKFFEGRKSVRTEWSVDYVKREIAAVMSYNILTELLFDICQSEIEYAPETEYV